MYDTILVPTDGSDGARRAAEHARALAERFGSVVHVVNVVDSRAYSASLADVDAAIDQQVELLRRHGEAAVERLVEVLEGAVDVETGIVEGVPHRAILEYAADEGCDLIALGSHGRTGIDRYLLGSVSERVVRKADVPVLTVRADDERTPGVFDEIVVPTDGGEPADLVADHAIEFAGHFGSRIHAVHVVDMTALTGFAEGPVPTQMIDRLYEFGEETTAELAGRARAADLECETAVIEGSPARAIRDYASEHGADLIAMGTQGRTGLGRFLLGSVAERTVRSGPAPVLTIRATDRSTG